MVIVIGIVNMPEGQLNILMPLSGKYKREVLCYSIKTLLKLSILAIFVIFFKLMQKFKKGKRNFKFTKQNKNLLTKIILQFTRSKKKKKREIFT